MPINLSPVHSAEKAVNERLAHTPELYLLALAQFAVSADTEVVSFHVIFAFLEPIWFRCAHSPLFFSVVFFFGLSQLFHSFHLPPHRTHPPPLLFHKLP